MPPSTTTTRSILVGVDGSRTAAPAGAGAGAADAARRQHAKLRPVAAHPDHPVAEARAVALERLTAAAHARSVRPDLAIDCTDVAGSPDADRKVLT